MHPFLLMAITYGRLSLCLRWNKAAEFAHALVKMKTDWIQGCWHNNATLVTSWNKSWAAEEEMGCSVVEGWSHAICLALSAIAVHQFDMAEEVGTVGSTFFKGPFQRWDFPAFLLQLYWDFSWCQDNVWWAVWTLASIYREVDLNMGSLQQGTCFLMSLGFVNKQELLGSHSSLAFFF